MVPDFVRLGFTAATPLLNQGFPARFLDHIIPESKGGPTVVGNLVTACQQKRVEGRT